MDPARLSISDLCKSFSAPVLKNVNLLIAPGEVHAIVGENGAGKTTLVNILAGLVQKDGGKLLLDQVAYEPSSPLDGFKAGISCATQELSTIGTLSVGENIGLRNLPHKNFVLHKRRLVLQARELLQVVGLENISPDTPTETLSLAERQLVEVAKALASDCRLLILDEPTAALAGPQVVRLHEIITDLARSGTSVIYISHRLEDVLAVADTVSILRDGQAVSSAPASSMTVHDLIIQMSGQNYPAQENSPIAVQEKTTVLEVDSVTTRELPHPISFACRAGEIVGLAGLTGAGKSELLNALFGLTKLTAGRVCRCTEAEKIDVSNPGRAVGSGMGYLGEERISMGLFSGQSVVTNMMVPGIPSDRGSFRLICRGAERQSGSDLLNKLSVRCDSMDQPIEQLSGGNQQKVLIARWLHCDSVELAREEKLPGVVSDAIKEHHGTSVIVFFYKKALETDSHSSLKKDDFRYPGPRPRSKEAGLLMCADTVEAAVRSLKDPTPAHIRNMVKKLVDSRAQDGELDNSGITLNDLNLIKEKFISILTGIYHKRIAYPGQEEEEAASESVAKPV